jgi:uncharacterized protein (DUF1919 family)
MVLAHYYGHYYSYSRNNFQKTESVITLSEKIMRYIDVFNGDADGLCSLVQLRNAKPVQSEIITGVKRDIELLARVEAKAGDVITVLDISMEKNKDSLLRVLDSGAEVLYCDHHESGDIPDVKNLTALINLDANVCTSLLINGYLKGAFPEWAITGAFGDNLNASALAVAKPLGLNAAQLKQLENLGIYINYNGYGAALADLHFDPEDLFLEMVKYKSPFDFMVENKAVFAKLENGYKEDMATVEAVQPEVVFEHAAVFMLPNEKWARRVSGVYSNDLANNFPDRAHAVLSAMDNGNYLVSVRAPLTNKKGAVDICRQFATGGGRAAAAGINDLPTSDVQRFIDVFESFYR